MQKLMKWSVLWLIWLGMICAACIGVLAEEGGDSDNKVEIPEEDQNLGAIVRSVAPGYADMRTGNMAQAGFLKANGLYAQVYYSAKWAGSDLSGSNASFVKGQLAYCIEPNLPLIGTAGDEVYGSIGSKDYIKNMTTQRIQTKGTIFRMLGRILAVGGTETQDALTVIGDAKQGTRYMATQVLIWQLVHGDMDANFNVVGSVWKKEKVDTMPYWSTAPAGGKSVKAWCEEWLSKLKKSIIIPDFASAEKADAPTYTMDGNTLTLNDGRGILSYMSLKASETSVTLKVSGNQLIIQNPNQVDFTVTMENTICAGAKEPAPIISKRVSDGVARQATIIASGTSLVDPVQGYFAVKANPTGNLRICKIVEQDPMLTSSRSGYEFRVYSTQTGYDEVHTTDEEGEIVITGLTAGIYFIHEVEKEGINIPGSNFQFELPEDQSVQIGGENAGQTVVVTVQNQLRRGTLTIIKQDAANGGIKLAGTRLLLEKKVYQLSGETIENGAEQDANGAFNWAKVGEVTTMDGGKAQWENLTVGEYRLTETKAAPGYQLLAEPIYFSLPYQAEGQEPSWSYSIQPSPIDQEFTINNQPIYTMPSSGGMLPWISAFGIGTSAIGMILYRKSQAFKTKCKGSSLKKEDQEEVDEN